jgi:hypothetical protein
MTARLVVMPATAVLALFSIVSIARAQAYLPEDNLAYPVQVLAQGGGGTGFFVRRDRDLFLVTARHVLVNPLTEQFWAREATLRALSKDLKETAVTVIHLNSGQLQEERQIRTDPVRDVVVVRLGTLTSDGMNTTPGVVVSERSKGGIIVAPFDYLMRYAAVDISSQIFILGYPSIGVTKAVQIARGRWCEAALWPASMPRKKRSSSMRQSITETVAVRWCSCREPTDSASSALPPSSFRYLKTSCQ